jgi:hypothetical protein
MTLAVICVVLPAGSVALGATTGVTVRFAERQQAPPPDMPAAARRSAHDGWDHGPPGALILARAAALEITWWEARVFVTPAAAHGYVQRLLASPRGTTVRHLPWAQRLPVATLAVDVVERDGRRGRLLVWHHLPSIYAVWHDADDGWWFAYWMNDPDL